MEQLSIGDKIYSQTTDSFHIVESLENIEGYDLVFTEDIKCFPLESVSKSIKTFYDLFEKTVNNQHISEREYDSFFKDINRELNISIELFDIHIFAQTGVKIKPFQAY